jgi:hypothetical protein
MSDEQKKFYDTYGQAITYKGESDPQQEVYSEKAHPIDAEQPKQNPIAAFIRKLMGIATVAIVITAIFFVGGIFLAIIAALFLIGTLVRIILPGRTSSTFVIKR